LALVAERRVALPSETLPALSATLTRMSTLAALPTSSVARNVPLANVEGSGR